MADFENHFKQWRAEIQTTLAFEPMEIDELEDHLRELVEAGVKKGLTSDQAWDEAQKQLGGVPSLALEFAKSKLLPSLLHLLYLWWKPALLCALSVAVIFTISNGWGGLDDTALNYTPTLTLVFATLIATLALVRKKSARNAILTGVGFSLCLTLPLYKLIYNPFTARFLWKEWSLLCPPISRWQLALSCVGVIGFLVWSWLRNHNRKSLPLIFGLVLVLAFIPALSEAAGHYSMQLVWQLPQPEQVTLTGDERIKFCVRTEGGVTFEVVNRILMSVPIALITAGTACGCAVLQWRKRAAAANAPFCKSFPTQKDLALLLILVCSAWWWIASSSIERGFTEKIRTTAVFSMRPINTFNGMELVILVSAFSYLVAAAEFGKRLVKAKRISPFYIGCLVVMEMGIGPFLIWVSHAHREYPYTKELESALPLSARVILFGAVFLLAALHGLTLYRKIRSGAVEQSLWKMNTARLPELGGLVGLILALSGAVSIMLALVMAYESVCCIVLWQEWGYAITDTAKHFDPNHYIELLSGHRFTSWFTYSILYLTYCLATGWGIVIALSGLEFARFNSYRLFVAWRAGRPGRAPVKQSELPKGTQDSLSI